MINKKIERFLGIDWGEKRIGLALGDSEIKMAVPFKVVNNLEEILAIIDSEEIDKIIIGQPLKLSGQYDFPVIFKNFVDSIQKRTNIVVELIDERLTSKAADALIGSKKTKAPRDAIAAMLILQSYLDKI
jgi:putative Holliday junction resolvase